MRRVILCNLFLLLTLTGCVRDRGEFCDDSISAGRYMARSAECLGGKHGDSREVTSREEFMCAANDYIPLEDSDLISQVSMSKTNLQQAADSPGDPGSPIPGIDAFKDPMTIADLADTFKQIHFPYNSDLVKGQENLQAVRAIANYMKKHKETYLFIEGHCDERGAEAYNLALGSRRSNCVRSLLITEGVDPNKLFTISYGKERPMVFGHNEESWKQNRRAEFKIYQR